VMASQITDRISHIPGTRGVREGGSERGLHKVGQKNPGVAMPLPSTLFTFKAQWATLVRQEILGAAPGVMVGFCAVPYAEAEFKAGRMEDPFRCHRGTE
jgi:hypothetical protein